MFGTPGYILGTKTLSDEHEITPSMVAWRPVDRLDVLVWELAWK